MIYAHRATVRLSFNSVPVEIEVVSDLNDPEGDITPEDVKQLVTQYLEHGFAAPASFQRRESNVGQRAIMTKPPVYLADKKMWKYSITLNNGKEFTWNDFSRTSARVNDLIEVQKNDRGFEMGMVIDPNQPLPGLEEPGKDDIPF